MTRQYWANLALCILLGAFVLFSISRIGSALTPKGLFVVEPSPSSDAEKVLKDVLLVEYPPIINDIEDSMVTAEFLVRNDSAHSVKSITVLCDFEDEKEQHRDRKVWTFAERVTPGEQKPLRSISKLYLNRSARFSACRITDLQLVEKPFFALERHVSEEHGGSSGDGHEKQPSSGH